MARPFTFGFGSDDIVDEDEDKDEDRNEDENGEEPVKSSCDSPQDKLVAPAEPRLHQLQDLV